MSRHAMPPDKEAKIREDDELYHLWKSASPERHARLDALFRERRHARDLAGCQALLDAVVKAGGEGDPLLSLCRGIMESEMLRDWGAAEAHFSEVLEHRELAPSLRARALMNLGLLDRYQGRHDAALRHLAESCRIAEEAGDWLTLANALMNRGNTCTEGHVQGQLPASALEDALAFHTRSKDILHLHGETGSELRAWNNMGTAYKAMGRLDEALAAYRMALSLTPSAQRFVRGILTNNIAEVEEARGRWAQAHQGYEEALAIYREIGDDYEVADALLNLGSIDERRGLIDGAVERYREAISAIESVRAKLSAEEARAGFLGTRLQAYERLIALSLTRPGGESLAFDTVERAKARAFIELLADRPLRRPQAVPASLLEREQSLREALGHLYKMGAQPEGASPVARRIAALESELEEAYRRMRRLDAEYASSRSVDPLPLADVQNRLPAGAALVEYFQSGSELGCFVVTAESARAVMLPEAAASLQRYMESAETADGTEPAGDEREDEFSRALLAPIQRFFADYEDLYIVPHGPLHYVPLHALGTAGPILERHRVMYAPSASVLLGQPAASDTESRMQRAGCLALGYNAGGLHFAELEARHVAGLAGGKAYTGAEATSQVLYQEGQAYRTVHLACHGTFNPQAPLASGLLLGDGKLDAMTVFQTLRLQADLVVLSACDTGQAAVLRGDELMGLARAILYAGSDAVLVSLWQVDDLAAALLMDAFYRARSLLPAGPAGAAEALRQAQLALRSMPAEAALAASRRLGIGSEAKSEEDDVWTGLSPAHLYAAAGDSESTRHVAGRARTAPPSTELGGINRRVARWARPRRAPGNTPYAHPYFWAAFGLICRSVPAPPFSP